MSTFQISIDLTNVFDLAEMWDVLKDAILEIFNSSTTLILEIRWVSETYLTVSGSTRANSPQCPDSTVVISSDSE